jgi:hypothetical protein
MRKIANLLGGSLTAWWFTILTLGPLLGSLITEPAAMTISALLLGHKLYDLEPSEKFKYATIGLLFVNISVGGTMTHFAAPPVLMVAGPWNWGMGHMILNFGWKALVGILISNGVYFLFFRKELSQLQEAFALRILKDHIQLKYLSHRALEAEFDSIVTALNTEMNLADSFDQQIGELVDNSRKALTLPWLKRPLISGLKTLNFYRCKGPCRRCCRRMSGPSFVIRSGMSVTTRCRPGLSSFMCYLWAGRYSTPTIPSCLSPVYCFSWVLPR